jgi:RNA polymerase sigma-70 factor (ECF subfamily)
VDESEFSRIYGDHRDAVYRYARLLTGSPEAAEDITHECFLALAKGNFCPALGMARGYLLGTARRQTFKRFRGLEREVELDEKTPAPVKAYSDLLGAVAEAVAALPPLQREAVLLFSWEGFKLEEIPEMTGVDTGTIKSRLSRGRESLRERLAPYRSYVGGSDGTVAR